MGNGNAAGTAVDGAFAYLAVPQLYQRNSFRLTGLPVGATAVDIRRAAERLRIAAKLGNPTARLPQPLPPPTAPDPTAVEEALRRMKDPVHRFTDEFFWFWPLPVGAEDRALTALARGEVTLAGELWHRCFAGGGRGSGTAAAPNVVASVARHNLAVLTHACALDDPGVASGGAVAWWGNVFTLWRGVLDDDMFWAYLGERALAARDPRLVGLAENLRAGLPMLLGTISASLALRAAENGRAEDTRTHVTALSQAGFDDEVRSAVYARALTPVTTRIRTLCQAGEDQADADPGHADQAARNLLDRCRPLLAVVDMILDEGDPVYEGVHDDVARQAVRCQIPYANESDDWAGSIEVFKAARGAAATDGVRTFIDENIAVAEKNLKETRLAAHDAVCWFCRQQAPDDGAGYDYKMHGEVERTSTGMRWKTLTAKLPRCRQCYDHHELVDMTLVLVGTGVFIVTAIVLLVFYFVESLPPIPFVGGAAALLVPPGIIGAVAAIIQFIRKEAAGKHPRVRALLDRGWKPGESPPEAAGQGVSTDPVGGASGKPGGTAMPILLPELSLEEVKRGCPTCGGEITVSLALDFASGGTTEVRSTGRCEKCKKQWRVRV